MSSALTIEWADQQWELLAEKALHWPGQRAAIVADVHFGKAATFRHHGVPVPRGATPHDLARLTTIVDRTHCERLIILGDFLHAKDGRDMHTMRQIGEWRESHPHLDVTLVRGNHDVKAGDPPEEWRIDCVDELRVEGIVLRHAPHAARSARGAFEIAGHVHPCVHLRDVDGSSMRAACFAFSSRSALLPAFGSFTGGHPLRLREGDRVFAVGEGQVIEVEGVCA